MKKKMKLKITHVENRELCLYIHMTTEKDDYQAFWFPKALFVEPMKNPAGVRLSDDIKNEIRTFLHKEKENIIKGKYGIKTVSDEDRQKLVEERRKHMSKHGKKVGSPKGKRKKQTKQYRKNGKMRKVKWRNCGFCGEKTCMACKYSDYTIVDYFISRDMEVPEKYKVQKDAQ